MNNSIHLITLSTAARARPPIVINVECLRKKVSAICDQIRTVDKSCLIQLAGNLSA